MTLEIKVSKKIDASAVELIKSTISTVDPALNVDIDLASQTISVEPKHSNEPVASEESIRQAVTAAGYPVKA